MTQGNFRRASINMIHSIIPVSNIPGIIYDVERIMRTQCCRIISFRCKLSVVSSTWIRITSTQVIIFTFCFYLDDTTTLNFYISIFTRCCLNFYWSYSWLTTIIDMYFCCEIMWNIRKLFSWIQSIFLYIYIGKNKSSKIMPTFSIHKKFECKNLYVCNIFERMISRSNRTKSNEFDSV